MTPHDHRERVPGCSRCETSADEALRAQLVDALPHYDWCAQLRVPRWPCSCLRRREELADHLLPVVLADRESSACAAVHHLVQLVVAGELSELTPAARGVVLRWLDRHVAELQPRPHSPS